MSSNPLNDLSQVYLDQVANVKKAENEADIKRWEDLGGPTPTNYKPTGASAKLSRESKDWKVKSDWRNDIFEAGDPDATQTPGFKNSKDVKKKVTEKSGIKNTVVINPKLNEAIKEIGGEIIVAEEVEEIDEDDQTRQQQLQKKQLMIDRQKLQLRRRAIGKKKKENNDGGSETDAQANVIANEGVMTMLGRKKKEERKPEKAMDAGAKLRRLAKRREHAKYVSGSEDNVPDDIAEASAVLDANKKIKNQEQRKKDEKEYARLMAILAHQKDLKKRGLGEEAEKVDESKGHKYDDSFIEGETGSKTSRRNLTRAMSSTTVGMGKGAKGKAEDSVKRRERHQTDRGVKTKGTKAGHSGSAYPKMSKTLDDTYPHKKEARLKQKLADRKAGRKHVDHTHYSLKQKTVGEKLPKPKNEEVNLGEEGYDRMRDDRLVKYGIGHDGSDKSGPSPRPTGKRPKGDTNYQKEMRKKYGGKLPSAVQVVTDKIKEKYGKGAIHNAK